MFTFIAFLITLVGSANWMTIGLLQYDFIAGIFGFQASLMSRVCYIIFGVSAAYLLIRTIANKGSFRVFERKNKNKERHYETEYKTVEVKPNNFDDN